MANQTIFVKQNRFTILNNKPNSWQILVQKDNYLNIGDTLLIQEIDEFSVLTGRECSGIVMYFDTGIFYLFDDSKILAYFYSTTKY